jgi:type II secretory pathway component PulF
MMNPGDFGPSLLVRSLTILFWWGFWIGLNLGFLYLIHLLLTLPMRRAERSRLFLDLIETALNHGQPVEETLVSVSQSRDPITGKKFHRLAAQLSKDFRLGDTLAKAPYFLSTQIRAMLQVGERMGDLKKVLPACRHLLEDAVSQTRGALNYLVILTFVITPAVVFLLGFIATAILPRMLQIAAGMKMGQATGMEFLFVHRHTLVLGQVSMLLVLWFATFIYLGGPRVVSWFPILDRVYYRLPWRRKRMQRDFSAILVILLDSGVPEPEAVSLAAECTANRIFRSRAARAVEGLKQGMKLPEAMQFMDDAGEFGWRLANAFHARTDLLQALTGWHESLDAKAFQQEQAAAHGITTALVLWSGLFVGAVVVSVFMFLTSIIYAGTLW